MSHDSMSEQMLPLQNLSSSFNYSSLHDSGKNFMIADVHKLWIMMVLDTIIVIFLIVLPSCRHRLRLQLVVFFFSFLIFIFYSRKALYLPADWSSENQFLWPKDEFQGSASGSAAAKGKTGSPDSVHVGVTDLKNTKFSFMRSRGQPFGSDGSLDHGCGEGSSIIIDVLSIGSQFKMNLLEAQVQTWASHCSVRNFFGATESDDADPTCHERLDKSTMKSISDFCRGNRKFWKHSLIMTYQRNHFAHDKYLRSKPPGWLCAQKRPSHAIGKLGRFYREYLRNNGTLPDYFLIMDDDTYYNLELFEEFVKNFDPSVPFAEAGCLVQNPLHIVNFSFPFGGFGLILSKGAISNLIKPIHCNDIETNDTFQMHVCSQLEYNFIGEKESFESGMSVSDLMDAHASRDNYTDFPNWKASYPYCFHSDWVTGFYVNLYHVSNHVSESEQPFFKDISEARIGWHLGLIYHKRPPGNCQNSDVTKCDSKSQLCHMQTPESMKELTAAVRSNAPSKFLNLAE